MGDHEVLMMIEAHGRRLEVWDDLLVNLARNIVAPPKKGAKSIDVKKMKLFGRAQERPARVIDLEEARERQRRIRERNRALGLPKSIKKKWGDIPIKELD